MSSLDVQTRPDQPGRVSSFPEGTCESPVIVMKGIYKQFPGVIANADVNLTVNRGEIHALLGENGAGKSTLMNILTGIYKPDAGGISIDGKAVAFASPLDAISAGIGMVHQHFKLVQAFTVAENIHLGWKETPRWATSDVLTERTAALARRFNLPVDPEVFVADLSAAEQQRVEILRVLSRQARVLVLDEPTAVLSPSEAKDLFAALRHFRDGGNSVIFISHKLNEILDISDRVSVLRGGRKIATEKTKDCTASMLGSLMVGRTFVRSTRKQDVTTVQYDERPVMSLKNVSVLNEQDDLVLKDISLDIYPGEMLAIAGVAGNGQRDLSEVLTGVRAVDGGSITIDGNLVGKISAAGFLSLGIGHIPEDRLKRGLAPSLGIVENALLREYRHAPVASGAFFRPRVARDVARRIVDAASVNAPSLETPVCNLSGGNQQRLVARREIRVAHKVLVAAYPSRGLDVGAIETMFQYFADLQRSGGAVVLISEELDEILMHADRIAVMYEGEIIGIREAATANIDEIGMMLGGRRDRRGLDGVAS